jgi:hypothetical protein
MTAHTPGPWERNIKPATKYSTVWSGRNTHVAHVTSNGLSPEEVEANISLVAAAPDLLAALVGLVEEWDDGLDDPFWNAARAAIARAKGDTI